MNLLAVLNRAVPSHREPWDRLAVRPPVRVVGRFDVVGVPAPLPSSAAQLALDDKRVWCPHPDPDPDHTSEPTPDQPTTDAPVYQHGGRLFVFPFIRLLTRGAQAGTPPAIRYLTLADWLAAALTAWTFESSEGSREKKGPTKAEGRQTVAARLRTLTDESQIATSLWLIGWAIRYALFGADRPHTIAGLRFPAAAMVLRPFGGTSLARAAMKRLVITASASDPAARPHTDLGGEWCRIRPDDGSDRGIDPVHTPEGDAVRLIGRLGDGIGVLGGRLVRADTGYPPVKGVWTSVSAGRIPFRGFDDPRRLLMAAGMQTQAVPVRGGERPHEREGAPAEEPDPPGVNLRVGFLGWRGLNHEDAWVLSESAATKLTTADERVYTLVARRAELPWRLRARPGQAVTAGFLLCRRRAVPLLLVGLRSVAARRATSAGGVVALATDPDDRVAAAGIVTAVEEWYPAQNTANRRVWEVGTDGAGRFHDEHGRIPRKDCIAPEVREEYRAVYRVTVRHERPLCVGDKLANRHGHKGVVGAILPDDQMPLWAGQPLEAMLDPVGVVNRSNWGQVKEGIDGAKRCGLPVKDDGTALLEQPLTPPTAGEPGMTGPATGVVGVQFVMRLPQHAAEKLSGAAAGESRPAPGVRRRPQRFGEMDRWALWGHEPDEAEPPSGGLTPQAQQWIRLLAAAGYSADFDPASGDLTVARLPLAAKNIKEIQAYLDEFAPLPLGDPLTTGPVKPRFRAFESIHPEEGRKTGETRASLYRRLDEVTADQPTALVLVEPVSVPFCASVKTKKKNKKRKEASDLAPLEESSEQEVATVSVHWLPVLPANDRPPVGSGSREQPHPLTRALRRAAVANVGIDRAAVEATNGDRNENDREEARVRLDEARATLVEAVRQYLRVAYGMAVGLTSSGAKRSHLRDAVLGGPRVPSARAVISPAGPLSLGLDQIAVPPEVARTLFGREKGLDSESVWLKRDPVLHRWGMLRVGVTTAPGTTVRLPASLLGPLGADFDGDTVALFATAPTDPPGGCPSSLAAHDLFNEKDLPGPRVMFAPGKQYLYGLARVAENDSLVEQFRRDLLSARAPDLAGRKQTEARPCRVGSGRPFVAGEPEKPVVGDNRKPRPPRSGHRPGNGVAAAVERR